MPRGDRRGPEGRGPRTGRALGCCAGFDRPGFAYTDRRGGFGRGRRHRFYATGPTGREREALAAAYDADAEDEASPEGREFDALLERTRQLERSLEEIRLRLDERADGPER